MFIVGFATVTEIAELEGRGWEVESAEHYNLVGESTEVREESTLMAKPSGADTKAVVIFVDNSLYDVMSGPGWDKGDVVTGGGTSSKDKGTKELGN